MGDSKVAHLRNGKDSAAINEQRWTRLKEQVWRKEKQMDARYS